MKDDAIRSIDPENLKIIEIIFSEIPEEELILECINRSQIKYFFFLRSFFSQISKAISNYFLGKPLFEEINATEKAMLEIELEKWLCFYSLIQWGWDYIIEEAERKGYRIESTPGEILKIILANHTEHLFALHQASFSRFSPRKAYKQLSLIPKMEGILNRLENGGNLKKEDIETLNKFNKLNQRSGNPKPELNDLFDFCISVFHKNRNKAKIKYKYKDYLRIQSEQEASTMKSYHPRANSQGWKIEKQELLPLT